MSLGFKHFELLELLQQRNTLQEVMRKTNLSERNIRYQIDELNDELKREYQIKFNKNDIIWENNFNSLNDIFKDLNKIFYSYSSLERVDLIIFKIVLKNEPININRLSIDLEVTKPTLRNDLKKAKLYLEKFNIHIIQQENSIYNLEYNKLDLCYFLASYIDKYQILTLNKIYPKRINYFYKEMNETFLEFFEESYKTLEKLKRCFNYSISDNSFNLFLSFLLTVIKFSPEFKDQINNNFYKNTIEYKKMISKMSIFKENQKIIITDFLIGLSYTKSNPLLIFGNWINIEMEIYKSIKKFSQLYSIDLSKDKILLNELINHIKPMLYRSSKKIFLENSIYNEIMDLYEKLFYSVKYSFENLEKNLNIIISDDETAFITLMFHRALKRNTSNKTVKNVAIICNYGLSASKFLEERLNEVFYIQNTKTYSLNDFYKSNLKSYDLIISTIDINDYSENIPLIKVNPLLTEEDIKLLKNFNFKKQREKICFDEFINTLENNNISIDKKNLKDIIFSNFSNFFIENNKNENENLSLIEKDLFSEADCSNLSEAIKVSCYQLLKKGYINEDYIESLLSKQSLNNPNLFIGNQTILPHAIGNNSVFSTKLSFLKLKNPIFIKNKECSFIITFCTDRKTEYVDFLIKITEFFNNPGNEENILTLPIEEIYNRIETL
ncbi:PRD domain-containing protein [uncultured Cetobacterium sp.]|uniref:BglG family transcription antiterminator n=1 Tax=uncultured Cetobacterium sp. TaxID=527638 RepID=UPI0025EE711A|nr:PRD domain-containing protein [uncultured Cetobacterium sp.]